MFVILAQVSIWMWQKWMIWVYNKDKKNEGSGETKLFIHRLHIIYRKNKSFYRESIQINKWILQSPWI